MVYFVSIYSTASFVTESNTRFTDAGTRFDTNMVPGPFPLLPFCCSFRYLENQKISFSEYGTPRFVGAQPNSVNTPKSSLTECRRLMLSMCKRMTVKRAVYFLVCDV